MMFLPMGRASAAAAAPAPRVAAWPPLQDGLTRLDSTHYEYFWRGREAFPTRFVHWNRSNAACCAQFIALQRVKISACLASSACNTLSMILSIATHCIVIRTESLFYMYVL